MEREPSLNSLICKTASGDHEAFEQLFISQRNIILFHIRRKINCCEDVEDVCQKVAIRIFQNIGTLKSPEAFRAWLSTLVVRECLRHFAAQDPAVSLGDLAEFESMFVETDTDCLPLEYMEQSELRAEMRTALERVPETVRQMVSLHYDQDMKYREIADHMGVSVGSVSVNLHRAKNKLRKELTQFTRK